MKHLQKGLALLLAAMMALSLMPTALAYSTGVWPSGYSAPGCTAEDAKIRNDGNHWYNCTEYQEPDCTNSGYAVFTCVYCGDTKTQSYPAEGHVWGEWETEEEPTCTEPGKESRSCGRCMLEESRTIPATGHDWGEWDQMYENACTEPGQEIRFCNNCFMEEVRETAPKGHDWGEWFPYSYATCTEPGQDMRYCSRCQAEQTRDTAALGHTWSQSDVTQEPTCTEPGVRTWYCFNTEGSVHTKEEAIPALGHDWSDWATLGGETCNEPGMRYRTCSRCNMREEEDLPAQNHTWGPWKQEYPGTCMQKEMNVRICLRCGAEDYRYGDFGDHDWDEWKVVIPATDTEPGVEMRFCKLNPDHVEEREIPATGNTTGTTPEGDPNGNPDGTTPEEKADLTVTVLTKNGESPYGEKTEFKSGEKYWFHTFIENTGNVDVELYDCDKSMNGGAASTGYNIGSRYLLHPGETVDNWDGYYLAGMIGWISESNAAPGTETETLAGTLTFSVTVPGYKPGTDEVICTGEGSATIGLLKEDGGETPTDAGPNPELTLSAAWAEDAGEGKCYVGAEVTFTITLTNTGNCPTEQKWGDKWMIISADGPSGEVKVDEFFTLQPGESVVCTYRDQVSQWAVDKQKYELSCVKQGWYADADGERQFIYSNDVYIAIPLTYPDGQEPEPANPALKVTWTYDDIEPAGGAWYTTTEDNIYGPEDGAFAYYDVLNAGNVPLKVKTYFSFGNGYTSEINYPDGYDLGKQIPGASQMSNWGTWTLSERVTPGTETEELMGTVDITIWAKGFDPETGEELCTSNEITRSWPVRKPGPTEWNIPSLSAMAAEIKVSAGYESSDPAGYQLGENYGTHLITENTGSVAITTNTIHVYDPYDGWTDTWYDFDFEPGKQFTGGSGCWNWGTVTEEDVARGYIYFPPVEFTWEDPDSGETMHAYSNSLTLPVISETGLLVEKRVGNTPANGSYFTAGETIQWQVTVTNTSNEPIKNMIVTDQGETIGEFAEIAPGETVECAVPGDEVTEYDVSVGFVSNQAVAKGTDLKDAQHTWFGNIATAPTSKKGAEEHPLIPPTDPEKGQTGDPEGGTPGGGETTGEGTPETPEKPGTPGGGKDDTGAPFGVIIETSVYKTTAHGPQNGEYYEADETVDYAITIRNSGETALENMTVTDSLHGLAPVDTIPSLAPGEEKTVSFSYTVTQADIDLGYIVNQANIAYTFLGGKPGTPQKSNKVYVKAGENGWIPGDGGKPGDGDTSGGKPTIPGTGEGDFCAFTLTALGGSEIRYVLHACAEHTEAAKNAEAASAAEAVDIWKAEIDKLYQTLYDAAKAEAQAAVMNDRAAFWAYADAYRALYGEDALAGLLRLRCAGLCCMARTAPEALPDSILGSYASSMSGGQYGACAREFSVLDGSDCEVTVKLNKDLTRTLDQALSTVRGTKSYAVDQAFVQTQSQWQMALDGIVNANYKAADKETRKAIAAWRKLLDQAAAARKALLEALYPNNPETVQEALANLYRDAAIDAGSAK